MNKNDSFNAQSASSAQLDAYLRDWLDKPEAGGEEEVLAVLDELSQREEVRAAGRVPDAKQAWERFQKSVQRPKVRLRKLTAIAAVAIMAVVLCVVPAFGEESLAELIPSWDANGFEFAQSSEQVFDRGVHMRLTDIVQSGNTDQLPLPKYIPEGMELSADEFINLELFGTYSRRYESVSRDYYISAVVTEAYDGVNDTTYYEKDSAPVETIERNGLTIYLFDNLERNVAVWLQDGFECSITTDLPDDELLKMVDSVFEED